MTRSRSPRTCSSTATHLGRIGPEDLLPQGDVAAGDAGDIAQPGTRQREVILRRSMQSRCGQDRKYVRHVGHDGHGTVVRLGIHLQRYGADQLGNLDDSGD